MSQSPSTSQTPLEQFQSIMEKVWAVCRFLWVVIILAIIIGALSAILAANSNDFLGNTLVTAMRWLFSSVLYAKIVLVVVVLFIVMSAFSGIIVFQKALVEKEEPVSKYVQSVSVQLEKAATNSVQHNENFVVYRDLIQHLVQNQIPQLLDFCREDVSLKQEATAQRKELNEHLKNLIGEIHTLQQETLPTGLKNLTAEIRMLQQEAVAQRKELNEHLKNLIGEIHTLQQEDSNQRKELNEHLKDLIARQNGTNL